MFRKLPANIFLAICFLLASTISKAQLYEVGIDEKIANSNLVIEGKVVSQQSFWNDAHTMIFTSNKVEVYKVFKGTVTTDFIEVMTQGGTVGTQSVHASDLLELNNEQIGVFFCFPNVANLRSPETGSRLFDVYSSGQGYFNYNLHEETAGAPFVRYQNIATQLYGELVNKIGHGFENKKPSFDVTKQQKNVSSRVLAPAITSFSPTTVNAGALSDPTNNVLTITGSGFGASFSGSAGVLFADANNGGASTYNVLASDATVVSLIVSWSDTEIKIKVPARAGTGFFTVRDVSGSAITSSSQLNVAYAVLVANYNVSGYVMKQLNLMNQNNLGGYSIVYSTNTSNSGVDITASPAQATFKRALATWKEIAGFNVVEAGTTTIQTVADDNNNTIMFDNAAANGGTPLSSGVLATCYSFSGICTPLASFDGRKMGFDIVIRSSYSSGGTAFVMGPCPPNSVNTSQTDLESVLFHELGHAINLAHVIDPTQGGTVGYMNPAKLMNYAISNSTKRTSPDYAAKMGGLYTCTSHNRAYGTCYALNNEMTQLTPITEAKDDCPGLFPTSATAKNTSLSFDMVHTSSNLLVDPVYTKVRCDALGAAVTNNAYYAIKTNTSGTLSLTVNSYITVPSELASCTQLSSSIPVTGFRVALYQLSSCPSPGSYPAPVACRTFAGNGAITDITGLTANTNYLLFIESIENTKATFNLVLDGTALPIKVVSFTGEIAGNHNSLNWVAESIVNVNKIVIERSSNAVRFEALDEVTGTAVYNKNGNYKDLKPIIGNSYYRLKIVNNDGSIEYSNIVQLKRSDKLLLSINPNPAVGFAEVQVSSEVKGNYTIVLHNNIGQQLLSKTINVASSISNTRLDVSHLPKGTYSVTVLDPSQTKIKSMLLSVQ